MKSSKLLKNLTSGWLIALCLASSALITACGESSSTAGVGSGGTGSYVAVSGTVADGYLVNATVFLDKNGNYLLDTDEPFTTTDANGAYMLNVDTADVGTCPIVALAIKDITIDRDTNQAVPGSYLLSMSKDNVSRMAGNNFISPISTQLREMMETGKYTSAQHASSDLSSRMGLPGGTNMMSDYINANNTAMHTAAQNMATLMGNQMDLVLGTIGSNVTVDVNRYRAMMGLIYSNMATICAENNQTSMSNLNDTIRTELSRMSPMMEGQPFRNMSTAYRGMMGGN